MAARPRRDARPYHRSGEHIVAKAMPFLVERVTDPSVPDDVLTPVERTVRGWRDEILEDLGGDTVSAAKRAILDAAVGSKIILSSLDSFLFQLASSGRGMVNRRARHAFRIVNDRMRVADSLVKQLSTLGLDRVERPPVDLGTYLSQRRSSASTAGSGSRQGREDRSRPGIPSTTCGTRLRRCCSLAPLTLPRRRSPTWPPRWATPLRRRPSASTPGGFPGKAAGTSRGSWPSARKGMRRRPFRDGRPDDGSDSEQGRVQARFVTDPSPMAVLGAPGRRDHASPSGAGIGCNSLPRKTNRGASPPPDRVVSREGIEPSTY